MFTSLTVRRDMKRIDSATIAAAPMCWDVRPMRSLVRARADRGRPDLPLLTVARERGVFVRSAGDDNHNAIPEDLTNYKVAHRGDLVINKMKAWQGSLGLSPADGIVSPAYHVYEFAIEDPRYGEVLLRSRPYVGLLAAASDGVRVGQWDLDVNRFRELPVLVPPAEEQAAIVKYLGHAHARIDKAIAAKRKMIALLEEQKQAIIHQAVTRGLDPEVPLKNSGIPWLGAIPQHWTVGRLRGLFTEFDRRSGTGAERLLSLRARAGLVFHDEVSEVPIDIESLKKYKVVAPGNLVMNRMRAASGLFAVAEDGGLVSPDYSTMTVSARASAHYYLRLFKTPHAMAEFRRWSSGLGTGESGFLRLQYRNFGRIRVPIPPVPEQLEIANAVDALTRDTESDENRLAHEIALLQDFRARLTSDVVTGQVDVREIAATLPELPDNVLAADVADAEESVEEAAEEFLEGDLV